MISGLHRWSCTSPTLHGTVPTHNMSLLLDEHSSVLLLSIVDWSSPPSLSCVSSSGLPSLPDEPGGGQGGRGGWNVTIEVGYND